MENCKHCGSTAGFSKAGSFRRADGTFFKRKRCKTCLTSFSYAEYTPIETPVPVQKENPNVVFGAEPEAVKQTFVFTSCQNDTEINHDFYDALKSYCEIKNARLVVLRTTQLNAHHKAFDPEWLVETEVGNISIQNANVKILNNFKVSPSQANPLSGLDILANGQHLIMGHPQLQMKTLPSVSPEKPVFAYTTGTISVPNYTYSKAGCKAEKEHTYGALVVVVYKDGTVNMRCLLADETGGFYDIDGYYNQYDYEPNVRGETALITGDEHAIFMSEQVRECTYTNSDSMVHVLKPKYIVRHDVLDFYSGSHHHMNNYILRYEKAANGKHSISDELYATVNHILSTTPHYSKSLIIASNHNDHLMKWLNFADPKVDLQNARLYHWFMYQIFTSIELENETPNPFELWVNKFFGEQERIQFIGRDEEFEINGIKVAVHGDKGVNGSRGSAAQMARMPGDYVIGHSHSPKIEKGCFQVGTSTSRLDYAVGPTTWANTHCVIYPNGKRQLLTIVNGKWY